MFEAMVFLGLFSFVLLVCGTEEYMKARAKEKRLAKEIERRLRK